MGPDYVYVACVRSWANATVVDGGLAEFVRDLKVRPGGDIGVHASISVAQALPSIQLESIRSSTSPTGHLLADYRVVR
jgi:hypothetical protein